MKTFKTLLLLAVTAIFITACGKDEEPEPIIVEDGTYIGAMTVYSTVGGPVLHIQEGVTIKIKNGIGGTMDIEMQQVQFAPNMPVKIDMTIPGITSQVTTTEYALSGNDIIPLALGGPFPQYTIKDFEGTLTSQNAIFSMICGVFPLSFEGTKVVE